MLRGDPPTLRQGRTLVVGGLRATLCCKSDVEVELSVQQWRALLRDLSSCPGPECQSQGYHWGDYH